MGRTKLKWREKVLAAILIGLKLINLGIHHQCKNR